MIFREVGWKIWQEIILDGRPRWPACREFGIEPEYNTYLGDQPASYVISNNLRRRHLNKSQEAGVAWKAKPALAEEARKRQIELAGTRKDDLQELIPEGEKGTARDQAGELFNVSGRYVDQFGEVEKEAPELAEAIMKGEITITEAKRKINRKKRIGKILEKAKELDPVTSLGKCAVIYADPPWQYDYSFSDSRGIENQYPTSH